MAVSLAGKRRQSIMEGLEGQLTSAQRDIQSDATKHTVAKNVVKKGGQKLIEKGMEKGFAKFMSGAGGKMLGGLMKSPMMSFIPGGAIAQIALTALSSIAAKKLSEGLTKKLKPDTSKLDVVDKYGYAGKEVDTLKSELEKQLQPDDTNLGRELIAATGQEVMAGTLDDTKLGKKFTEFTKIGEKGEGLTLSEIMNYANDPSEVLDKDKKDSEDTEGDEVVENEVKLSGGTGEDNNMETGGDEWSEMDSNKWATMSPQEQDDWKLWRLQNKEVEGKEYGGLIYEDGGQVFEMDQLASLLSLLGEGNQMQSSNQNTEKPQPTITEYFASQGKTLGGNNIQSLSQKLGR